MILFKRYYLPYLSIFYVFAMPRQAEEKLEYQDFELDPDSVERFFSTAKIETDRQKS